MRLVILALVSAASIAIPMEHTVQSDHSVNPSRSGYTNTHTTTHPRGSEGPLAGPRTLQDIFDDLKQQITTVTDSTSSLSSPFAVKSCSAVELISDAHNELGKIVVEVAQSAFPQNKKSLVDDIDGIQWCIWSILVDPQEAQQALRIMNRFKQRLDPETYFSSRHESVSKMPLGHMPEYTTIIPLFKSDLRIILRSVLPIGGGRLGLNLKNIYHARRRMHTQLVALKKIMASTDHPPHLNEDQKKNVMDNLTRIQLYVWYLLTGYPDRPDDVNRMKEAVTIMNSAEGMMDSACQIDSNFENSRVPSEKLLDSPPTLDDLFARCRREAEIVLKAEPDMTASPDSPATRTVNDSRLRLDLIQYALSSSVVRPELKRERPKIKTDVEGVLLGIKRNISCILFSHPRRDDPDRRQAVANLKIFVGFYTAAHDEHNRKFHENIDEIAASFRKEGSCSHFRNPEGDRARGSP